MYSNRRDKLDTTVSRTKKKQKNKKTKKQKKKNGKGEESAINSGT